MRTRELTLKLGTAALTCTALSLATSQALAAEYWLKAAPTSVSVPSPSGTLVVSMWGYASCTDGSFANCSAVTVPGPALTVPPGDATLAVHLLNTLNVPTSLVINGLIKPMAPVWTEPGSSTALTSRGTSTTARVRSFDAEAAPNGTADYSWGSAGNPVKPGTYLYQSGTHPSIQVPMGLYGALVVGPATGVPCPGTPCPRGRRSRAPTTPR